MPPCYCGYLTRSASAQLRPANRLSCSKPALTAARTPPPRPHSGPASIETTDSAPAGTGLLLLLPTYAGRLLALSRRPPVASPPPMPSSRMTPLQPAPACSFRWPPALAACWLCRAGHPSPPLLLCRRATPATGITLLLLFSPTRRPGHGLESSSRQVTCAPLSPLSPRQLPPCCVAFAPAPAVAASAATAVTSSRRHGA